MPRSENLSRLSRRKTGSTNVKRGKSTRTVFPLVIVGVAVLAAVAFTVSVESRRAGWLWKSQPASAPVKADAAKSSPHSTAVSSNRTVAPQPLSAPLVAPTVTATKNDSLFTDVDLDGKADPGDTLKYTVSIGSSGQDATGVTFTDTVDPNTAFVGGSLAASPVATNDTFPVTVTGNVRINSANLAVPFSVVSNDFL